MASQKGSIESRGPRIAVVDDEKNIREVIRIALEKEFPGVPAIEEHSDGLAAWETWSAGSFPDLAILDITMPRMDGLELCRRIRAAPSAIPVIFLSSRDEEIDKVLGLESGGDDYVCKPFSLRELLARIKAGLRRTERMEQEVHGGMETNLGFDSEFKPSPPAEGDSAAGDSAGPCLILDAERFTASWNGTALDLTVTEFRILHSLTTRPGFIKTREQLMAAAFPEDTYPNDRAADSHIKRIRKKILAVDPQFDELEAVYGLGYRWCDKHQGSPGYRWCSKHQGSPG
ncbi:DNA-binding response regulator [Spirochaetia bacterium]|nr:DNA-binding response regulator [Spirochaetia bacterium]